MRERGYRMYVKTISDHGLNIHWGLDYDGFVAQTHPEIYTYTHIQTYLDIHIRICVCIDIAMFIYCCDVRIYVERAMSREREVSRYACRSDIAPVALWSSRRGSAREVTVSAKHTSMVQRPLQGRGTASD